jgi:hypothetical protein
MICTSVYIVIDRAMRDRSLRNFGISCLEKIHLDEKLKFESNLEVLEDEGLEDDKFDAAEMVNLTDY